MRHNYSSNLIKNCLSSPTASHLHPNRPKNCSSPPAASQLLPKSFQKLFFNSCCVTTPPQILPKSVSPLLLRHNSAPSPSHCFSPRAAHNSSLNPFKKHFSPPPASQLHSKSHQKNPSHPCRVTTPPKCFQKLLLTFCCVTTPP